MRIVVGVELYMGGTKDGSYKLDIDDMAKTSRELRAQLIKASRAEAAEVAQALIDQIGSLKPDEAPAASLKLIKELAMGPMLPLPMGTGWRNPATRSTGRWPVCANACGTRCGCQAQQAAQAADGAGQSEQAALKHASYHSSLYEGRKQRTAGFMTTVLLIIQLLVAAALSRGCSPSAF